VCILPPIDETATIALSGYENGDVVGERGFFVYNSDADFCDGGNWHRDGQWDINPYGRMVVHEGQHWLELNENTYHIDNIIIECPPGTTQPPIQEEGTWNEGLFMQLVDGAHNTVTNERGDEISWTLQGVAVIEMTP
jgi:flagellar basal body rod protein FlgG